MKNYTIEETDLLKEALLNYTLQLESLCHPNEYGETPNEYQAAIESALNEKLGLAYSLWGKITEGADLPSCSRPVIEINCAGTPILFRGDTGSNIEQLRWLLEEANLKEMEEQGAQQIEDWEIVNPSTQL